MTLSQKLFKEKDEKYRNFHSKLMPSVSKEKIIGVRVPAVRRIAKETTEQERRAFMSHLPHDYYEEDNLHAVMINEIKSFDLCLEALDVFLPYIDNWATCDMLAPKVLEKNKEKLYTKIKEWISSEHCYTVRFAIGMLMRYYLDEDYRTEYSKLVQSVNSNEYYVNMMIAWFFASALAKQYNDTIVYLEKGLLSKDNHRRTIQKAIDSYRIKEETKAYLRTLR